MSAIDPKALHYQWPSIQKASQMLSERIISAQTVHSQKAA